MSHSKPQRHQEQDENDESEDTGKSLWDYFTKRPNKENEAQCSLCSKNLKISKGSFKGLKVHLDKIHCINISSENSKLKRSYSKVVSQASTSKPDTETVELLSNEEDNITPKKKNKPIDSYFKMKNDSMEAMVSRMICKDGLALSTFCTSTDLRNLFRKSGFQLPQSPNTIRTMINNFANTVQADMIIEFEFMKKQNQKFSLTFDEWTSQKNHRYLNLNVHHQEKHFNLGLIRIKGSCTAEHAVCLVKDRLKIFGLDLDSDIIGMTTDGASVMVKAGTLVPCYHQLCVAHGIQLAVVNILYRKKSYSEVDPMESSSIEMDDDDCDYMDELDDEQGATDMSVIIETDDHGACVEMVPKYNDLLQKVRKVVKIFRKSPTKDDLYLQKYVREEKGKELQLILDCRTRWNSLLSMVERFYDLKVCIEKALIDIKSEVKFTDHEWSIMKDLITSLQPFKLAVETLCRRESTLLTADTVLKFIIDKLSQQDTVLSNDLSDALRVRIKERRTILTGILTYIIQKNMRNI